MLLHVLLSSALTYTLTHAGIAQLDPSFVKGYQRTALAQVHTRDLDGCQATLAAGLALAPGNADLLAVQEEVRVGRLLGI